MMILTLIAQKFCIPGGDCIDGPIPTSATTHKPFFTDPASIISAALAVLFPIAGFILFINLVWGGFQYLISQGDEKAISAAKGRMTTSLIGFFLLIISFWIAQVVSKLFRLGGPF